MTETTINKMIDLLNNNKIDDVKKLLQVELLKNNNSKNIKLIDAVKKYLKNADSGRPVLKTVMIKNNTQFICNGYSLYVFNKYIDDLNILDTTDEKTGNVIDYTQIVKSHIDYNDFDDFDSKIYSNIEKIVKYYKTLKNVDKKSLFIIPFANKFFDAKMILETKQIFENDQNIKIYKTEKNTDAIQLKNDKITAVLLPCRIFKDDEITIINNRLNDCFKVMEG